MTKNKKQSALEFCQRERLRQFLKKCSEKGSHPGYYIYTNSLSDIDELCSPMISTINDRKTQIGNAVEISRF